MIYDYVIVGNNLNSLMIAFYLFKENNKVLIIEKKNKNNFFLHINNKIVYKNPMYSNNDVNFLNFLNDINIDFKSIGSKINISFDLANQFNLNELFIFFLEFINHFINEYESKQIKLSSKLKIFSDKSIDYIIFLCTFYNYDFNEISYYDFIQIINNCVINEFFIINDNEIITQIFDYFSNNTNIKIIFDTKFENINNNIVETTTSLDEFSKIRFIKKCIFSISAENINFINNKTLTQLIYNYTCNIDCNNNILTKNVIPYHKSNNNITFFSNYDIYNFLSKDNKYNSYVHTKKIFIEDINYDTFIIINNKINIEENIKRNFNLINNLIIKKKSIEFIIMIQ